MGLSETKLSQEKAKFTFKDQDDYKAFHSCDDETPNGAGVALLVHKSLAKNIHKIERFEGKMIILHFKFKGRKRLCIIQIYLPSEKRNSEKIQNHIQKVIKEERLVNSNIVVMGDFNAVNNPMVDRSTKKSDWKPEAPIFPYLEDSGFLDIHKHWEEAIHNKKYPSHTWKNTKSSSRIDYIWLSQDLALNIYSFKNEEFDTITNSDHTLLQVAILSDEIIGGSKIANTYKKKPRTILDLKKMTDEKWKSYSEEIEKEIIRLGILKDIKKEREKKDESQELSQEDKERKEKRLQKIWDTLERTITRAGKNSIPTKKIKRKKRPIRHDRGHTPSFKNLREAIAILSEVKKARTNKELSSEDLKKIGKKIDKIKIHQPLLDYENLGQALYGSEDGWRTWETKAKENIKMVKEVNLREEMKDKEERVKKAIQKRCENLENNQRRMINLLSGKNKESIILDRILVKDHQEAYISTDPEEVKKETRNYYTEAFKTRNASFDLLNEEWKEEYKPKEEIKEEWFKDLMGPIKEEELNLNIKDLPNNKASGISGVNYEMLKKLGNGARTALREFFSLCLKEGLCPKTWKTSALFPIPKSKDWECNLANTRPIILLEVSRKLLSKMITNRLSSICKQYNLLKGPNYAGLPGESTQEPIHILNNICEEAREKKKELWICFQDTAKAFDTVNLVMLQKALERIKVPTKATGFIIGLFKNRRLKAITNYGTTEEIVAGDGIDQGETISPLLWRIFYDPLLNKIQKNTQLGYTMETSWRPDLNSSRREELRIRTAATAFMDDTTWLASSRENMQKILDEAAIFYKANDSQINGKKSVLIAINSPKEDEDKEVLIGPNKEPLKKTKTSEYTRYLGIWLGEKDHKKFTIGLLQREILQVTNALSKKKVTDKQVLYILNRVLIPRLEYRMQLCYLQEKECIKLTAKYMGKFKNAINLSKTCPNSIMTHKGIYGLKSIEEIQAEAQIGNLINRLNDNGPAGISTRIRLKDVQIKEWEPNNILTNHLEGLEKIKGNLQANILALVHKMNIKIEGKNLEKLYSWKGGLHPIKETLKDSKIYKKAAKSMAKYGLMFLDQVIDQNNKSIISWPILKSLLKKNSKGPTPMWFKEINQIITEDKDNSLKSIYRDLAYIENHYKWTQELSQDARKKETVAFTRGMKEETFWGKVEIKKKSDAGEMIPDVIIHYTERTIRNDLFELSPCKGCCLNQQDARRKNHNIHCQIVINKKDKFKGVSFLINRKDKSKTVPYNLNYFKKNIEKELAVEKRNTLDFTFPTCTIHTESLSEVLIQRWIQTEIHKKQLIALYKDNKKEEDQESPEKYEFYTDGSLKDRGSEDSKMGSAWLQTAGPKLGSTFQNSITDWPSSSKAEATAILTALLTVPENREVEIFTDSQASIDTFIRLQNPHPKFTKRKMLKIKNWSIWTKIKETIQGKGLKVQLAKVKAHSGNYLNEKADQLAKEALSKPLLRFTDHEAGSIWAQPKWNEATIDMSVREFIKELNKKKVNFKWTRLNRNNKLLFKEIQEEGKFEWEAIWSDKAGKKFKTTPLDSQKKAFWVKLAQNELPTLDKLAIRKPKIYGSLKSCPVCNREEETLEHLFECPNTRNELSYIWEEVQKRMSKPEKEKGKMDKKEERSRLLSKLKNRSLESPQNHIKTLIGLFEKEDVKDLQESTGWNKKRCSTAITDLCEMLREEF